MKKTVFVVLVTSSLLMAGSVFAADKAAAITNTTVTTAAAITITPMAAATVAAAITQTASPAAITATAAPAAGPFIQGVMPPSIEEGAYEEPGEPAPTAEEAGQAVEKKSEVRKKKHFTIEQTLYTPSSIGTKIGYFINENWRVAAEYSTISGLIANSNHEKNASWAISGNYSPADDDWSPFYGAGIAMMDLYYHDTVNNDSIYFTKQFTGGYIDAGVTWITDSIFMASLEFDLYAGKTRLKQKDITTPSSSNDVTTATLSVMIGATVGFCF